MFWNLSFAWREFKRATDKFMYDRYKISQKPAGTETAPMEVDTKPTEHEQNIQQPLTIGEQKLYDSDE